MRIYWLPQYIRYPKPKNPNLDWAAITRFHEIGSWIMSVDTKRLGKSNWGLANIEIHTRDYYDALANKYLSKRALTTAELEWGERVAKRLGLDKEHDEFL